jgi:uncharacterized membrane protein YcaP (DUF421 family)
MFDLAVPWWELAVRGAAVYLTILVLLRLCGKRQVGELTPFDLVLLLLISEAASPALTAQADSWLSSTIVIVAMIGLNGLVSWASTRWRWFENVVEGQPQFLLRHGKVDYAMLRRESVSHRELLSALRDAECFSPRDAEYAVLEASGKITVKKRDSPLESGERSEKASS